MGVALKSWAKMCFFGCRAFAYDKLIEKNKKKNGALRN